MAVGVVMGGDAKADLDPRIAEQGEAVAHGRTLGRLDHEILHRHRAVLEQIALIGVANVDRTQRDMDRLARPRILVRRDDVDSLPGEMAEARHRREALRRARRVQRVRQPDVLHDEGARLDAHRAVLFAAAAIDPGKAQFADRARVDIGSHDVVDPDDAALLHRDFDRRDRHLRDLQPLHERGLVLARRVGRQHRDDLVATEIGPLEIGVLDREDVAVLRRRREVVEDHFVVLSDRPGGGEARRGSEGDRDGEERTGRRTSDEAA